jgi:hypothetical protein
MSASASSPLGVLATFISIIIATIGIVNSFVLSRYNERASRRKASFSNQLDWLRTRAPRLPENLFQQSVRILENELKGIRILTIRSFYVFLGIPPLACFLSSFFLFYSLDFGGIIYHGSLQVDTSMLGLLAHISFLTGVVFLIPYVIFIMMLLWAFLKFFTAKKCQGELKWVDPKHEDKTISESFREKDQLKVRVLFKGFVTNGFIDTILICTDGDRDFEIWVPDKLTYLSPTTYDHFGVVHIRSHLDTGTLQGDLNHVFPLEFRVGESSHHPIGLDYFLWEGERAAVYEDYCVPSEMQIKELRIRMYVDPLFSPRLERDYLDELIVKNSDIH